MKDDVKPEGYTREQAVDAVGRGWTALIHRVFNAKPPGIRVLQVKEKFGKLRIYHGPWRHEEFGNLLHDVENQSATICELCGQPGQTVGSRYLRTLCPTHAQEHHTMEQSRTSS